jgi:hypothetical protein
MDPNFILSTFTTGQIENWSDSNWSNAEYDRLYELQGTQMDPQARKETIWKMQELTYRESPEIFIAYPGVMSAWNVKDWQGWVRAPVDNGHPFGTQYFDDTYRQVRPVVSVAAVSGSSSSWWIAAVVAAAAVARIQTEHAVAPCGRALGARAAGPASEKRPAAGAAASRE